MNNDSILGRQTQWVLWAIIIIAYVGFRLNPLGIPLDRDEGVFGLIGQTILDGGLPYRDAIDHKPPLIFYTYALALLLFPPTPDGIHGFAHLYNFLTLITLFFLAKRMLGHYAAYWAALSYAVFSINPALQGFTASTEIFMLLPLMLSLLFAMRSVKNDSISTANLILSGIFGALACWYKQPVVTSVAFAPIIIAYLLWRSVSAANAKKLIMKAWGLWLVGGLGISAIIIAYFIINDVYSEFIYWSFQHSMLYSSDQSFFDKLVMAASKTYELFTGSLVFLIGLLVGMLVPLKRKLFNRWMLLIFLLLSFLGTAHGHAYPHYFAQFAPAVALLMGAGIAAVLNLINKSHNHLISIAMVVSVIITGEALAHSAYYYSLDQETYSRNYSVGNFFAESVEIARYLKNNTSENEKIFIYGSEPQILLQAERRSTTAFYVIYPLMRMRYPRYLEFQKRVVQEIKTEKPAFILNISFFASILWDQKAEMYLAAYLGKLVRQEYRLDKKLLFAPDVNRWLPDTHPYFKIEGVESLENVHIVLYKRNDFLSNSQ